MTELHLRRPHPPTPTLPLPLSLPTNLPPWPRESICLISRLFLLFVIRSLES